MMKHFLGHAHYYTWMVRLAIALGLLLSIGWSIFMFANKDIVPAWDMVNVLYFLIGGLGKTMPNWLSSDLFDYIANEHRPLLPMLIWGFDFQFFDSYGILPQILMQLFAIMTVVWVTGWSRPPAPSQSMTALAIILCGCALVLSPMHYENLVWPVQIHVYTSVLLSVFALSVAVFIPGRSWRQQIGLAMVSSLLAFCATFSFGYGLVVWPVLLIHGLLARWPWKAYLTIMVASAGTIVTYYSKFTIIKGLSDPTESILDPFALTHYVSLLLAGPIVGAGIDITLSHIMGYIMLTVFAYASFRVYIQGQIIDDQQVRSLLICLYCIGAALLTALVRVTVNTGYDSRYRIIPTLFILAMPGLFQLRPPIQSLGRQLAIVAFLFGTLGLSLGSFFSNNEALRIRQFLIREGAIVAAFNTEPNPRGLFPPSPTIYNNLIWPYYFEHHGHAPPLNIFMLLGQKFPPPTRNVHPGASEPQCIGHVDTFINRAGDTEFDIPQGWARLGPKGEREAEWIIITDSSGVMVGLATTGTPRHDVEKFLNASWLDNLLTATNRAGFMGLVRSQPGDALHFFAYKDGEFCQFASHVKAPDA